MQTDPAEEWRRLTRLYSEMGDIEIEDLADQIDNLTSTAQDVLREELKKRGLTNAHEESAGSSRPASSQRLANVNWETAPTESDLAHSPMRTTDRTITHGRSPSVTAKPPSRRAASRRCFNVRGSTPGFKQPAARDGAAPAFWSLPTNSIKLSSSLPNPFRRTSLTRRRNWKQRLRTNCRSAHNAARLTLRSSP
jgi:hypothetical protein